MNIITVYIYNIKYNNSKNFIPLVILKPFIDHWIVIFGRLYCTPPFYTCKNFKIAVQKSVYCTVCTDLSTVCTHS